MTKIDIDKLMRDILDKIYPEYSDILKSELDIMKSAMITLKECSDSIIQSDSPYYAKTVCVSRVSSEMNKRLKDTLKGTSLRIDKILSDIPFLMMGKSIGMGFGEINRDKILLMAQRAIMSSIVAYYLLCQIPESKIPTIDDLMEKSKWFYTEIENGKDGSKIIEELDTQVSEVLMLKMFQMQKGD
jgi:hypothetical protein